MKRNFRKVYPLLMPKLLTMLLVAIFCISSVNTCPVFSAAPQQITLEPTADAYIRGAGNSTKTFNETTLVVKRNPAGLDVTRKTFMKFDLSSFASLHDSIIVTNATLSLYGFRDTTGGTAEVGVYQLDDSSWSETELTWQNAPQAGFEISTLINSFVVTNTSNNPYKESTVDLTSYFADKIESGNYIVSIVLDDNTKDKSSTFASKEHTTASYRPKLTITYATKTTAAITDVSTVSGGYQIAYDIALGSDVSSSINYIAIYNGNDLIGVRSVPAEENVVDFQTDTAVTKARLFIWDGIASIKPLCSPLEYPVL